jgi:hypothetical protein
MRNFTLNLSQPMRFQREIPKVYKADILKQRKSYRKILGKIRHAKVIYTIEVFCPQETCLTHDNSMPFYSDDNHLLKGSGGMFLLGKLLKPYLEH